MKVLMENPKTVYFGSMIMVKLSSDEHACDVIASSKPLYKVCP
jgi:hypothetical protein